MNSLKRIFISIKGQIDQVADDFENHEALAAVAILDLKNIANKTRLHLHRVNKMTEQYQKQINELQEQEQLWATRAIKAKHVDEEKALQCVKRMRQAKKQRILLEQQWQKSTQQENKIRADLEAVQEQLQRLNNKKEMLSARQNRMQLQNVLQDNQPGSIENIQGVFDRWEGVVVSSEYDVPDSVDTFSDSFEQEEDHLELKEMLDELVASENPLDDSSEV